MTKHSLNRLTAKFVESARKPGRFADGGGLYLQVGPTLTKSWFFRYMIVGVTLSKSGKPTSREMGLGPFPVVTLAAARDRALDLRRQLHQGLDPLQAKHQAKLHQAAAAARSKAFRDCVELYLEDVKDRFDSPKAVPTWRNSLTTHAYPVIGDVPVSQIDDAMVIQVLRPIWSTKNETADRVRGRIQAVLSWAGVQGYRDKKEANPAIWKGNLEHVFPPPEAVAQTQHFPSEPYPKVPAFITKLKGMPGMAPRTLEFIIYTNVRTDAAIKARWEDFDLDAKTWVVPAKKMKGSKGKRRPFPVPLSRPALEILRALKRDASGPVVFLNPDMGKKTKNGKVIGEYLSNNACLAVLDRMGRGDITVHGFRSSFRTWAGETQKTFARETIEFAMAHKVVKGAEGNYYEATQFMRRIPLMEAWGKYCTTAQKGNVVVQLQGRRKKEVAR